MCLFRKPNILRRKNDLYTIIYVFWYHVTLEIGNINRFWSYPVCEQVMKEIFDRVRV